MGTVQCDNFVVYACEGAADLAVATFVHADFVCVGGWVLRDGSWRDVEFAKAIVEHYAFFDALLVAVGQRFVERHLVDFLLFVARMRQLVCQIAVMCEQQQSAAVFVETADGVENVQVLRE